MKVLVVIFLFVGLYSATFAQRSYNFEATYHRGFLLPHRTTMRHLPQTAAQVVELRISKPTFGNIAWQALYNFPSVDFSVRGFDLGNKDVLGYGVGTAFIFSRPFLRTSRFLLAGDIGAGPGFVSKIMDYQSNFKNVAMSSHLNVFFTIGAKVEYKLFKHWSANAALSFNHFSNTAVTLPNLGINYPLIGFGLNYKPASEETVYSQTPIDTASKITSHWQWSATLGLRQNTISREVRFPAFTGTFERVFGVNKKVSIASGMDVFNNTALLDVRRENGKKDDLLSNTQLGAHANYQLHVSDFVLLLGAGLYVIDSHKKDGILYNRAGFKYYPTDHWGMNVTLKTHKFKADFFEVGVTHKF